MPWGRSFEEYVAMFDLTDDDLRRRLLGCGDGPAAFNAEMASRGGSVVSVDPIYAFDVDRIRLRIAQTYDVVMEQMRRYRNDFLWTTITSVEALGQVRMAAMNTFLDDYEIGKKDGRYLEGELPELPLTARSFDIALSSHFLFLYSTQLSLEFHIQALEEMLRLAGEVRVFPLITLEGALSPHLPGVLEYFSGQGLTLEVCRVGYEFQRGANEMLRIR